MKSTNFNLIKIEADEGKVFDWKEEHSYEDENGKKVIEHLYAKTLFLSVNDSADNYIEVIKPEEE